MHDSKFVHYIDSDHLVFLRLKFATQNLYHLMWMSAYESLAVQTTFLNNMRMCSDVQSVVSTNQIARNITLPVFLRFSFDWQKF